MEISMFPSVQSDTDDGARAPMARRRGCAALVAAVAAVGLLLTACETAPVTGRKQLVVVPESQAKEMGLTAYQKILNESKLSTDKALVERVRRVGQRIAKASGRTDFEWEFNVIEDDTPNAFALPGGKVGVNTGLFKVAKTDDQLAAVMAHEVGHAIARHGAERISQQMAVQLGLSTLGVAGENAAQYTQLAAMAATLGVVLPHSRTQESEADHIGVIMMAKAGYDPRAAVTLWENFAKLGGNRQPEFLSTHPAPTSRIENLKALMPEAMAVYKKSPKA
jgi:predicted Zn-dependent protease